MPTYLPGRLLDQAEQRDFAAGIEPYMLDLQKQVTAGIGNLGAIVTGLSDSFTQGVESARRNLLPEPATMPSRSSGGWRDESREQGTSPPLDSRLSTLVSGPGPALGMGQDLSTPGYLSSAVPAPTPSGRAESGEWSVESQEQGTRPPLDSRLSTLVSSAAPSGFTLPSFEQLTGAASASPAQQQAGPAPAARPAADPFALPSWEQLTGLPETILAAAAPAARPVAPGASGAAAALGGPPGAGAGPSDVNAYLTYAAQKAGIDPAQVLAVMGKEGPTGWGSVGTFDTGTSYGPLQLHYAGGSNPKAGMGDRFTAATGIDLRKDSSLQAHQAAVDFAMGELLKRGDWSEWYGAEPALGSRFTKVKRVPVETPSVTPNAASGAAAAASVVPPPGTYTKENLQVNQISQGAAEGLSSAEALAVCGPAAAVAFARANGRNPTLREAKELASSLGLWDQDVGMHGPASQVHLLQKMGVPSRLEQGTDWGRVAAEVQAGRPVILDSPQHYYVATGYDPNTGQFEFGASAGVLRKSGGRTRFRPDEIPSLGMGDIRATIYMGAGP